MRKLLFGLALFMTQINASIQEIHSVEEVRPYLDGASTLVLFDVDMVLLQSCEPAYQMPSMIAHKKIAHTLLQGLSQAQKDLLVNLMIIRDELSLLEESMPRFVQELKERGIPAIALTGAFAGKLEHIEDMTVWRFHTLQSFGYDFTYSFPHVESTTFETFSSVLGGHPRYDRGIIYTNGTSGDYSKGDVLLAFLNLAECYPKRILFLDDRKSNLEHVKQSLNAFDPTIEFLGFHYLGATKIETKLLSKEEFSAKWSALITDIRHQF